MIRVDFNLYLKTYNSNLSIEATKIKLSRGIDLSKSLRILAIANLIVNVKDRLIIDCTNCSNFSYADIKYLKIYDLLKDVYNFNSPFTVIIYLNNYNYVFSNEDRLNLDLDGNIVLIRCSSKEVKLGSIVTNLEIIETNSINSLSSNLVNLNKGVINFQYLKNVSVEGSFNNLDIKKLVLNDSIKIENSFNDCNIKRLDLRYANFVSLSLKNNFKRTLNSIDKVVISKDYNKDGIKLLCNIVKYYGGDVNVSSDRRF